VLRDNKEKGKYNETNIKNEADMRSAGYKEDADAKPTANNQQPTAKTGYRVWGNEKNGKPTESMQRDGPCPVYWGRWLGCPGGWDTPTRLLESGISGTTQDLSVTTNGNGEKEGCS
jgi:hypothetical protein